MADTHRLTWINGGGNSANKKPHKYHIVNNFALLGKSYLIIILALLLLLLCGCSCAIPCLHKVVVAPARFHACARCGWQSSRWGYWMWRDTEGESAIFRFFCPFVIENVDQARCLKLPLSFQIVTAVVQMNEIWNTCKLIHIWLVGLFHFISIVSIPCHFVNYWLRWFVDYSLLGLMCPLHLHRSGNTPQATVLMLPGARKCCRVGASAKQKCCSSIAVPCIPRVWSK